MSIEIQNPGVMVRRLCVVLCMTPLTVVPAHAQQIEQVAPRLEPGASEIVADADGDELDYDALIRDMSSEDADQRTEARRVFEQRCLHASRPGAESERVQMCRKIVARLGPETPRRARAWMLRQLANIGGAECVPKLAQLLGDDNARIRELSRRALQRNPSARAAGALRAALDKADEPAWKVALINALAARRDAESVSRLATLARATEPGVAAAAVAALGDIGDADAARELGVLYDDGVSSTPAATDASLRVAYRLNESGQTRPATDIFEKLYASAKTKSTRVAALRGLAKTRREASLPRLFELMQGDDAELRVAATRIALEIRGGMISQTLAAILFDMPPNVQAVLFDGLGSRGDRMVLPAAQKGVESPDADVRLAAIRALGDVGDGTVAPLLATVAAEGDGAQRDAARESLARLRGDDVDDAIMAHLERSTPAAVRAELINGLAARRCERAIPTLLALTADEDEAVRVASFEALGELCSPGELPELVKRLIGAEGDATREAGENAVVKIALKIVDESERATPVLAELMNVGGQDRASLIRAAGRIGGERALAAIRAARSDSDAAVADAAVRALANWATTEVLDDLLEIARADADETHKVLALRGYVRLARLPSERSQLETFRLLESAMSLALRDDEKKLVLGALGEVRHADALALAESLLDNETLRDEAAVTVVKIARRLAAEDYASASSAIARARAATTSQRVRRQADEADEFLARFRGYCAAWLVAGPYMEEGKGAGDVFAIVFPPENDADSVEWGPLAINGGDNPWIFDLASAVGGGDRCVYVKTSVWTGADQPARLEIGSDDCVKAWLNGELVLENKAFRGVTPGDDTVDVTLKSGRNTLMLKIVQAGGAWGFCAGFKTPDGGVIDVLRFSDE